MGDIIFPLFDLHLVCVLLGEKHGNCYITELNCENCTLLPESDPEVLYIARSTFRLALFVTSAKMRAMS